MQRRVSQPQTHEPTTSPDGGESAEQAGDRTRANPVGSSGRVRHDEKITVYVSRDELLALEQGRLALRGEHAVSVDRGRIVREAIALALEDLAAKGAKSKLARRLSAK